ncbi:hypothetical protein [Brucella intermedia]|uniref:hypothetical protein n=1 Tax=Brucella intermedia TaxID=94625 RepID=UPI00124F201F|nr:hypothetical protein [Brucella intermedia]KAB2716551.1 hypothetical protein F9K75_10635 [Brucella intermedia]
MTYQQKVAEAQAFKAATNPKASDYPILSSEVGITAETLAKVADIVLAAFVQWQQIGAALRPSGLVPNAILMPPRTKPPPALSLRPSFGLQHKCRCEGTIFQPTC